MATDIILRSVKASALTHAEMDQNWESLAGTIDVHSSSATLAITDQNKIIECNILSGTMTLPTASAALGTDTDSFRIIIKNINSTVLIIDGNGAELIEGSASITISQYESVEINLDGAGTGWHVISGTFAHGLASTDGNFIVGSGTTWVAESGATVRTSLGLGTGDSPTFTDTTVTGTVTTVTLTTTGNTLLGNASTDTLNVGNGDIVKDNSGNTSFAGNVTAVNITGVDLTTTGNTLLGNASTDTINMGNGDFIKDGSGDISIAGTLNLLDGKFLYLGTDNDFSGYHTGAGLVFVNNTGGTIFRQDAASQILVLDAKDSGGTIRDCAKFGGAAPKCEFYYNGTLEGDTASGALNAANDITVGGSTEIVKESKIDWANAGGMTQGVLSKVITTSTGLTGSYADLSDFTDFWIYVPANASTIELHVSGNANGTGCSVRVVLDSLAGTGALVNEGSYTEITFSVSISASSGWVTGVIQGVTAGTATQVLLAGLSYRII